MAARKKAAAKKAAAKSAKHASKKDTVIALLSRKNGASLDEMVAATGWQAHSVRGFLAGIVGKKLGLTLSSSIDVSGVRRYAIKR